MNSRLLTLCALLSLAAPALAQSTPSERALEELQALRRGRGHLGGGDPELRAAYSALVDAKEAQEHYAELERELQEQIVVEESLIHRDRRYVAEGKPAALVRKLAAEREQLAADRRLRRYGRRGVHLGQAEVYAIDAVGAIKYLDEKYRAEVCRRVLELADRMERETLMRGKRAAAKSK